MVENKMFSSRVCECVQWKAACRTSRHGNYGRHALALYPGVPMYIA